MGAPKLRAEEPFGVAGAKLIKRAAREVFAQRKRVLDTRDIERVHEMRIATRRLRASLEAFAPCFEPKPHRKALREVKRLADALGARRDLDVQIAELESLIATAEEPERAAIKSLIGDLRADQRAANKGLAKALKRTKRKRLKRKLRRLEAKGGGQLAKRVRPVLDQRLLELLKSSTSDTAALHEMRIAAKNLRYLLELVGFCHPAGAQILEHARKAHSLLGDVRDCDVMITRLHRVPGPGGDALRARYMLRRADQLQAFFTFWLQVEPLLAAQTDTLVGG